MKTFRNWLYDHTPVWCCRCGRLMFRRDARYERTTTGRRVPLCHGCHKEIFNPFGWMRGQE